jgi:hypothetical protein
LWYFLFLWVFFLVLWFSPDTVNSLGNLVFSRFSGFHLILWYSLVLWFSRYEWLIFQNVIPVSFICEENWSIKVKTKKPGKKLDYQEKTTAPRKYQNYINKLFVSFQIYWFIIRGIPTEVMEKKSMITWTKNLKRFENIFLIWKYARDMSLIRLVLKRQMQIVVHNILTYGKL